MAQPLTGIRVLELAEGISGPFCGKLLADFGADVIKAEPPGGDRTRLRGDDPERSPLFLHLNTNKRSIVVDLATAAGQRRIVELARTVDIVIDGYQPGYLASFGFSYERLKDTNPAIVVSSVTPFGQTGPYAGQPADEITLYATGGAMNATGLIEREPIKLAADLGQYQCGNVAALATLAALTVAESSGEGVHVDVANLETQAGSIDRRMTYLLYRAYTGRNAPREGGALLRALPVGFYPTEDGYVYLATMPAWLPRMLATVADPELVAQYQRPDFMVAPEVADSADAAMYGYTLARTKQAAMEEAQAKGWPVTALKAPVELLEDPHFAARGYFVEVDHPVAGRVRQPGPPIRMVEGWLLRRPAPTLGQHDAEVAAEAAPRREPRAARGARKLPLEGVRVLDLTVVWAGPYATMLLGDLGAEVIRVDNPAVFPSVTRGLMPRPPKELVPVLGPIFGPYPDQDPGPRPWNRVGLFTAHARNKRCVTLKLGTPSGREAFLRLAQRCDVLCENNSAGLLDKLGITWDELHRRNPRLIVLRMPAVGLSGPYTDYLGFGIHYETLCGITACRGYADQDPTANGSVFHMDAATGPAGALAVLMALRRRRESGEGELVELAQAENMMGHIGELFVEAAMTGVTHGPLGNRHAHRAPQGVYRCRDADEPIPVVVGPGGVPGAVCGNDRWLAISVGEDAEWAALARLCGREDLAGLDADERRERHDELDDVIGAWTRTVEYRDAALRCREAGVPAGAVLTEADCYEDPQLRARGFFRSNGNGELGSHEYPGHPFRWDGPDLAWNSIPLMGEHNEHVFRDIVGFDDDEWAAHIAEGHVSVDYVGPDGTSL